MALMCRNVQQLHDAYLDGELSASMNAEVHAHLLQCPECQQQIELVRACQDVIQQDRKEPVLSSDFSSRVLSMVMAEQATTRPTPSVADHAAAPTFAIHAYVSDGIETRRSRRHRLVRTFAGWGIPVAAAVGFFCTVIWPPMQTPMGRRVVAPAVFEAVGGDRAVIDQTVDAVRGTARSFHRLNGILAGEADARLSAGMAESSSAEAALPQREPSIFEMLLPTFGDMLRLNPPAETETATDPDVVRF